jgi:hypothetical protein
MGPTGTGGRRVAARAYAAAAADAVGREGEQLAQLLASSLVSFVDVPNRVAHEEQLLKQADYTVNHVIPVHRRYPGLTGQGLTVSVKETRSIPPTSTSRGDW